MFASDLNRAVEKLRGVFPKVQSIEFMPPKTLWTAESGIEISDACLSLNEGERVFEGDDITECVQKALKHDLQHSRDSR